MSLRGFSQASANLHIHPCVNPVVLHVESGRGKSLLAIEAVATTLSILFIPPPNTQSRALCYVLRIAVK